MTALEQLVADMLAAEHGASGLQSKIFDLEKTYLDVIRTQKEESKTLSGAIKNYAAHRKARKEKIEVIIAANKELQNEQKAIEKLNKIVKIQTAGLKGQITAANETINAFKSLGSAAMGLVSAFGIQSFTLSGLAKVSLQYDKTLFQLTRTQNVSGRGMKDLGGTLKYVTKETKMTTLQFLDLSNTMLKGFVGVKPALGEIAKMMKVWGDQMGMDYESIKVLFEVQSKFPPLYDKMRKGLDEIDRINQKGGKVSTAQKAQLKGIQDQVIAYGLLNDIGSSAMETLVQALTPLTEEEKKYNELLKQRADLSRTVGELEIQFAKTFKPLQKEMLKTATKMVDVMGKFPSVTAGIAGAAVAMSGLTSAITAASAASLALSLALTIPFGVAFGWIAAIVAGVTAAGIGIAKWINHCNKLEDAEKKINTETAIYKKIKGDISKLNDIQLRQYKKLTDEGKTENETLADIGKRHQDAVRSVTAQGAETLILVREWEKARATVEGYQKGIDASIASLQTTISVIEDFGGRAQDALKSFILMSEIDLSTSAIEFKEAIKGASEMLSTATGGKITLDVSGDIDSQNKSIQDALTSLQDIKLTDDQRLNINNTLKTLMLSQKNITQKQSSIIKANYSLSLVNVRQQEKMTTLAEARLATERQLMESAQFGLGASVGMMQKQVRLIYKMMQGHADSLDKVRQTSKALGKVNDAELQRIENAETAAEAEDLIRQTMGKTDTQALALIHHWGEYQKISKKVMDHQQKIYELTKDIREGYLDAIREMSVGAGEFEKIIGTQAMGVTQLMDAVRDVTGVATTNTMALGGLQEQILTRAGVGTEITGRYTSGGLQFIGGETQEARNERIFKYRESTVQAKAAMRGAMTAKRSTVGSTAVPGAEKYISPEREAEILGQKAEDGTYAGARDGVVEGLNRINIGVMRDAFSKGEVEGIRKGHGTGGTGGTGGPGAFINPVLQGSKAPTPARSIFVPGIGYLSTGNTGAPSGKTGAPSGKPENSKEEYILKFIKDNNIDNNNSPEDKTRRERLSQIYDEAGVPGAQLYAEYLKSVDKLDKAASALGLEVIGSDGRIRGLSVSEESKAKEVKSNQDEVNRLQRSIKQKNKESNIYKKEDELSNLQSSLEEQKGKGDLLSSVFSLFSDVKSSMIPSIKSSIMPLINSYIRMEKLGIQRVKDPRQEKRIKKIEEEKKKAIWSDIPGQRKERAMEERSEQRKKKKYEMKYQVDADEKALVEAKKKLNASKSTYKSAKDYKEASIEIRSQDEKYLAIRDKHKLYQDEQHAKNFKKNYEEAYKESGRMKRGAYVGGYRERQQMSEEKRKEQAWATARDTSKAYMKEEFGIEVTDKETEEMVARERKKSKDRRIKQEQEEQHVKNFKENYEKAYKESGRMKVVGAGGEQVYTSKERKKYAWATARDTSKASMEKEFGREVTDEEVTAMIARERKKSKDRRTSRGRGGATAETRAPGSKATGEELRTQDEIAMLASQYRAAVPEDNVRANVTAIGAQNKVWELSGKKFGKETKARKMATGIDAKQSEQQKREAMQGIKTVDKVRKGITSAAAERGEESTREQQQVYEASRAQAGETYGLEQGTGGGGGGIVKVEIYLSKDLDGRIIEMENATGEIMQGATA